MRSILGTCAARETCDHSPSIRPSPLELVGDIPFPCVGKLKVRQELHEVHRLTFVRSLHYIF